MYLRWVSSSNSTTCIKCPRYTITNQDQSKCICQSGEFWDEVSGNCDKCPKGFYSLKGSPQCSRCPYFTTSSEGSENCKSCQINEYWNGKMCKKCEDDSISNGTNCVECPTGLIKLYGNGTSCKTWLMIKSMATSLYNPLWAAVGISILVNFILSGCLIRIYEKKREVFKETHQAESIRSGSPSTLPNKGKSGQWGASSPVAAPLSSPAALHKKRRPKSAPPIPLVKPEPPSATNGEQHNGPKKHVTSPEILSMEPMRDQHQGKTIIIPSVKTVPPSTKPKMPPFEMTLNDFFASKVDALYDFHDHDTASASVSSSKRYSSKKDIFEGRMKTASLVSPKESVPKTKKKQVPENKRDIYECDIDAMYGLNERPTTSKTVKPILKSKGKEGKKNGLSKDDEEPSTSQNILTNENKPDEFIDDDDIYATL